MSTIHDPADYALRCAKMAGEHFAKRNENMAQAAISRHAFNDCSWWVKAARSHNRLAIKLMRFAREAVADAVAK